MAQINANAGTLKQAAQTLRQAADTLELQKNTLNEVAEIVEGAWISQSTSTFSNCIRRTGKKVGKAATAVKGSSRTLSGAADKIRLLEKMDI